MRSNDTWLLIEDDSDDQDFFVMALKSITDKVDCVTANNGLEALRIIQKDDHFVPSCIFVDLNMPLMDGFDFLQKAKKIERLAEVPRIVYTTSNAHSDKERVSKLGAGYVTKYSRFSDLQQFIADCLSILINRSIYDNNVNDICRLLVDAAMQVMKSDLASIQLYCDTTQQLTLAATRNFHPRSIEFWQTVSAASGSVCGEALRKQTRITVKDVEAIEFVKDEIPFFRLSGIRAVQSTPLVSQDGKLIGMISTHWKEQRHFSENDFKFFDVFARLTADIISHKTTYKNLG